MTDGTVRSDDAEVLIVGAGPVGLTLANILGRYGVRTLVVEERTATVTEPRAVSVDDEGMRTMESAGLLAAAEKVVLPGTGTRYVGAAGQTLAYVRGPDRPRSGFTVKNPIYQPDFERMLLAGLEDAATVEVRFEAQLIAIEEDENGVVATLRSPAGEESTVRALYAVGCDGGRSRVRKELGVEMVGSSAGQPWLIVDARNDPHDQRYAIHIGDWRRPTVIVPGRGGRCRYEFMLLPGETPESAATPEFARRLLEPLRPGLPEEDLERCTVYNFHALIADQWRRGRILLAGDAAHMMPPFAAQGLNSGLRDANNLGWKLSALIRGEAGSPLLDSFELERRPHTEATIALSMRLGRWMMTTSRGRARVRDALVRVGMRVPPVRDWVGQMRYKPSQHYEQGAIWRNGNSDELVGSPLPNPQVLDQTGRAQALDEMLGPWFALVAVDLGHPFGAEDDQLVKALRAQPVWLVTGDREARERHGGVTVAALEQDCGLEGQRGRLLLVRPDRIVAAVVKTEELPLLSAAIPRMLGGPADDLLAAGVDAR